MYHLQQKYSIFSKVQLNFFLSRERVEGKRCMSTEGSSVQDSSQQSCTSGPKVNGGSLVYSRWGPHMIGEGLVNDTTPASEAEGCQHSQVESCEQSELSVAGIQILLPWKLLGF